MKKTLVTGATGFTGENLCRKLVQDGEQVVAFVRQSSRLAQLKSIGVECRQVDITDKNSVQENFDDINKVYHIAAAYRTEHSDHNEFRLVNVEATRNLLDAALSAKIECFVHCSTVGVQGEIKNPPADENYRFNPGDHYQESKLEGELLAHKYSSNGLPVAIVRPVGIYGPGDNRFLKLFRAINKGLFVMIGSGKVLYHMTYIDDLIQGIILAGRKPEAIGNVFTIAGRNFTTLRELVNMIADVLNQPHPRWRIPFYPVYLGSRICEGICRPLGLNPPLYPRRVEFFSLDRAFSIEKAKRLLGYHPKIELKEGLSKTAMWYKEQGLI
jgi:nucleoside-diphosphate-sugar epimerase